ncbi:hypothetical protein BDW59DRAFT_143180 [Aspergillus cavernicola]|uniref:BHLH domain-containing protein n=1 Tax=Aspergillus cavernicola TaxID=176166 RepID=A0ABR4IL27_9EURO
MSRSRLPPTPSMSGEFIIKDQTTVDGSDTFELPPAALNASRRSSKSDPSVFFPASPTSPRLDPGRQANPPPQAGFKRPLEDLDLPPPPTRTRKIIQMKPKTESSPKPAPKGNTKAATNGATPGGSKKKQPSATSAAGRKIARKTAHSLIERRRRSKMNEEFGTLKDMIPACQGQEMHKLAILQASIDYVNYLETCIQDLKNPNGHNLAAPPSLPAAPLSPTSPEFPGEVKEHMYSTSMSPKVHPNGHAANTSPMYSPRSRFPSIAMSDIPPAILPSPALGPIRPNECTTGSARSSWALPPSRTSPAIQPRFSNTSSADMDHEASAALLMLNRDPRGSIDDGSVGSSVAREDERYKHPEPQRKRMSVMDLLIS